MKKVFSAMLALTLCASMLAGCGGNNSSASEGTDSASSGTSSAAQESSQAEESSEASAEGTSASGPITVISREDGSGTRGAFVELLGASGDYTVSRPFNVATKGELQNEAAQDFMNYIMSAEGQAVVEEAGYIPVEGAETFTSTSPSGSVTISGSSSVSPLMEKLKEAYEAVNPNVSIELQTSDSTTGMTNAINGMCDIGMASRELKQEELDQGLLNTVIATDGIAIIVNNDSPIEELTSEQVRDIYLGSITDWSELG